MKVLMLLLAFVPGLVFAQAWNQENLLLYPIEKPTRNDQRIFLTEALPSNLVVGDMVAIRAAKGEFHPASFALVSTESISNLQVSVSDLTGPGGAMIPKEAVDLKIVKNWYQLDNPVNFRSIAKTDPLTVKALVPELLLNDDSLVQVDLNTQTNYLRVRIDSVDQYIDVSTPDAVFPENAQVFDAATLQPFNVELNRPRQIWMTVKVPDEITAGDYTGIITLQSGGISKTLQLRVTVLPFSLAPSLLEYSIYYRGRLVADPNPAIHQDNKSAAQLAVEFANMRDHGVLNPTVYQSRTRVDEYLDVRNSVPGLSKSPFYTLGLTTWNFTPENSTDPALLQTLKNNVALWKSAIESKGYSDLHIYGKDEARDDDLEAQRPAWEAIHEAGAKVFNSGYRVYPNHPGAFDLVGDLLDVIVLSTRSTRWGYPWGFQPDEVARWHSTGKRVFIYSAPYPSVVYPETYRYYSGTPLMLAGYDGYMNYAYQHTYGNHIWNDFDHHDSPDMNFTYPTTDGVIDTIQWEGMREGIDDVRYLSTLIAKDGAGSRASHVQWLGDELALDDDLDNLRGKIIVKIMDIMVKLSGLLPVSGSQLTKTATSAQIQVMTNAPATCRWGQRPNMEWSNMTLYANTGDVIHSGTLPVVSGGVYQVCNRCYDSSRAEYSADSCTSFSVEANPKFMVW